MTAIAQFVKTGWDVDDRGNLVVQPGPSQPGYFSGPLGDAVLSVVGAPIGAPFNSLYVRLYVYTRRLALDGTPLGADGGGVADAVLMTEGVPNTPPVGLGGIGVSTPIYPPGGGVVSQTAPPYVVPWPTPASPVTYASDAMLAAYAFVQNGYGLIPQPPPSPPPVQPIGIETVVAIFVATVFTGGQIPGPWVFELDNA